MSLGLKRLSRNFIGHLYHMRTDEMVTGRKQSTGPRYLPALALSSELCSLNLIWFFCHKNTWVRAQEEHDGLLPRLQGPGLCSRSTQRGNLLPLSVSLCCFSSTSSRGGRHLGMADGPIGFGHSSTQVRAGAKQKSGASLSPHPV